LVKPAFILQGAAGKRQTPVWAALLLSIIFPIAGTFIGLVLFAPAIFDGAITDQAHADYDSSALLNTIILLAGFTIFIFVLMYLWVKFYEKRSFRSLGFPYGGLRKFAYGCGLGALSTGIVVMLVLFYSDASFTRTGAAFSPFILFATMIVLPVVWFIQATSEEVVFRGFLLQALGNKWGFIAAALVSTGVFVLLHGTSIPLSFLYHGALFALGFFLCIYAVVDGSLWGPAGFHTAWNYSQLYMFGILHQKADPEQDAFFATLSRTPRPFNVDVSVEALALATLVTTIPLICILILFAGFFKNLRG
jgi:hypothetical protein